MAESTRMKELTSKVDTMMIVMDQRVQREEKMMAFRDQTDERMRLMEQSMINLTALIENQHRAQTTSLEGTTYNPQVELKELGDQKKSQPFYTRSVKVDFPRFQGDDVLQWIFQAERFCKYYGVTDEDRIEIASMHFDGPVVPWFQMMEKEGRITSWAALIEALEDRYGPSLFESPEYVLFKLTQEDSVEEYYNNFTTLANRVDGISPTKMLACFVSGLKKEIQKEVISREPESLSKAAKLAKLYEEKSVPVHKYGVKRAAYTPDTNPAKLQNSVVKALPGPIMDTQTSQSRAIVPYNTAQPTRRISFNEMQLRKAKGLCFNCDEKFSPTHRCQNRRLLLLQWEEESPNSEESESTEFVVELEPESTEKEVEGNTKLSLNAMNSAAASGTMRFTGTIKGHPVKILLDGGSDDNFIQPRIAKFLQLEIQPTTPFKVLVGDGNTLQVEGKVEPLSIKIQECNLSIPVYLLPIVGAEVIIGASWLATLGAHIMDYRKLSLQFFCGNRFVNLMGEREHGPQPTSIHQLHRLSSVKSIAECYQMTVEAVKDLEDAELSTNMKESPMVIAEGMPDDLKTLLQKYQRVFETPKSLPPTRICDHKIPLQPNSNPVRVRPYRYPHSQKTEIEAMVKQMLKDGLIETSNSPFSSPVILVKKKRW